MKKTLLVCMLLIAIVLSLAACVGNNNPPSNNETPHTHSFGEWDVTIKPTCTNDGTKVRYCSCGEKQSETIASLGHTPADAVIEDKVEATYEADGSYKEVVRCATCNEKLSETSHVIPMLKHTPADAVEENRVEATCYSEGSYDTVVYCSDCGAELDRAKHTIDKIAHTPATAVEENLVDSTCYSVGSKDIVVYCSVTDCGKELERNTETIGKKAHTPATAVEENRIEPTFEKDGSYQMVVYCSVDKCHEELERTTYTLDMLVHHPGNVVIENEVAATCTKAGSYDEVIYCLDENCGHKELSRKTITVPMISHTGSAAVEENRTPATCYSEGSYDSVVFCSVCSTELSRNTVTLQKIEHSPAEAIVENLINATCTTNGSYDEVVYCSIENCKVQISRTSKIVDAFGHTEVIVPGVDATCTDTGLTEGKYCNVCNTILATQTVTPIAAHNYIDLICTVCGTEQATSKGLEFTSNGDGTCYVSGIGTCTDADVVLPMYSPDGDLVTGIGFEAFEGCQTITSITISDSIIEIAGYPFYACDNLKKITIGRNVSVLEYNALYSNSVTDIYISDIGQWCNLLSSYEGSTSYYRENLYLNNNLVTDLVIPDGITSIGDYTFYNLSCIKSVTIPDSVTSIGYSAFEGCSSLKKVVLGNGIKTIENNVFNSCSSLTSISIPDSVISIGNSAFYRCSGLVSVTIGAGVESIGSYAFEECYKIIEVINLSSLDIKQGNYWYGDLSANALVVHSGESKIDNVNDFLFYTHNDVNYLIGYCGEKTDITLPDNYRGEDYQLYKYAFRNNPTITRVVISNNITKILDYTFNDCTALTEVVLGDNLETIGMAFNNCTSLKRVYVSSLNAWCNINFAASNEIFEGHPLYNGADLYVNGIPLGDHLIIPDDVTTIKYGAFLSSKFETVTIGNNVTRIEALAFYYSSIKSIIIPSSVQSIGYDAFSYCDNLEDIYISDLENWLSIDFGNYGYSGESAPSSNPLCNVADIYINGVLLTEIIVTEDLINSNKIFAIQGCSSIKNVTIAEGVTALPDYIFSNWIGLESVNVPNSVTSIGYFAFYNCDSLTSISLPQGITKIGYYAFCNSGLNSIVLPVGIKTIEQSVFSGCSNLTSVVIPSSVTTISYSAFSGCYKLVEVINHSSLNITKGNSGYGYAGYYALDIHSGNSKIVEYKDYLFYTYEGINYLIGYVGNDTNLTLPESYNGKSYEIYKYAFSGCNNITSVIIGNKVTAINEYAFSWCNSLLSVVIGNGVTTIGNCAFKYCYNLDSVVIGDSVTSIGGNAFERCYNLDSVVIGDSVTSIGDSAFFGCNKLSSVYITDIASWCAINFEDPSSNPLYYGSNLYLNEQLITELVIPDSVTAIGNYVFYYCNSFTSVIIGDGVTSIGYEAFIGCENLTSVVIGDSVTSIGDYAFHDCRSLTEILIPDNVTSMGYGVFSYCDNLTIYCEAQEIPSEWDLDWNPSDCPVVWGYRTKVPDGTYFDTAYVIAYNQSMSATIDTPGEYVYFVFTATENKTYTFKSSGSVDTYGYLYNSYQSQISYNDDGAGNRNFLLSKSMVSGETVYIAVRLYSSSSIGTFTVEVQ